MKLSSRISPDIERKLKDAVFAGKLVSENDIANTYIHSPVDFTNDFQEHIQFYIKCLSPIPEEVSQNFYYSNEIITGNDRNIVNYKFFQRHIDVNSLLPIEYKEKVFRLLNDKLILFRMTQASHQEYIYAEILDIEDVKPNPRGYKIIPGPKLNAGESKKDFEKRLVDKSRPFVLPNYPNLFEDPEFIYYRESLYGNLFLNKSDNHTTYSQKQEKDVKVLSYPQFMNIVDMRIDDFVYVVSIENMMDLRDEIDEKGQLLEEVLHKENANVKDENRHHDQNQHEQLFPSNSVYGNNALFIEGLDRKEDDTEYQFIQRLKENALKQNLYYDEKDLINFHTSVKTNMLTIIGGMSGTGKTQLALLYGKTLGLEYGRECLVIPISPSYLEPYDILGYLNPNTGVFHESETGLVRLLMDAENNPDKLYVVVFDEMNLSQIEHWFSPFISLLELEKDQRYLSIFHESSFCVNQYKSKIKIGENVIFVGTVNLDETTKEFSDRLLDRANLISPKKLGFKAAKHLSNERREIEVFDITTKMFKSWKNNDNTINAMTDAELEILDELHDIIQSFDHQKGVSFRVVLGISRFLNNLPRGIDGAALIPRSEAFDLQIKQRILTKLKGPESVLGGLVGTYHDQQYMPGKLTTFLQQEQSNGKFTFIESIRFLQAKAKELSEYGYAR